VFIIKRKTKTKSDPFSVPENKKFFNLQNLLQFSCELDVRLFVATLSPKRARVVAVVPLSKKQPIFILARFKNKSKFQF